MLTKSEARTKCMDDQKSHQETERAAGRSGSLFPVFCEERAEAAKAAKEFWLAAEWFHAGSCCCLGHNRAERYEDAAENCRRMAKEVEAAN